MNYVYLKDEKMDGTTIIFTFISLFPVLLISVFFKNDLAELLEYTGGLSGMCLMLLFPSLLIRSARINY